ncbi:hypothetical protein PV08_09112 [Exophiala spinifera]|uniref:Zn(2)-C6 fungal-type domain-containing protein n=1 Tax=Exophiala spinifera TaxID=91928 RepID=A0A0D2BKP7_9EURO|nr:uncharacterized protein PV08_09112 [Exophiala spinifera]KIW11839.1 hypothetical protein PV08_09112 [Exophiala spinifera]
MPNYGRSGRCLTCKRRRVKCDEARPACSQCRGFGVDCEGYFKEYAFRDESHKFTPAAPLKVSKVQGAPVQRSGEVGDPSRSLLTEADVAVPFFLVHYVVMGRSLAVTRGFYEVLMPISSSQPHDSPLSLAVAAVAARVFCLWRHGDGVRMKAHLEPYTKAVASLRSALSRPEDRRRPAIALAVLALHLYESISAVYDARCPTPVHHQGALSLLPIMALDSPDGDFSTYVKGFVLHSEISSALRQNRSIHPSVYSYVNSEHTSFLVPGNLSSTLDSIGASVAELQADYVRRVSPHERHASGPLLRHQCSVWITKATQIDELLRDWARDVPDHWRPVRLTGGKDFSNSIAAYQSACDIYPSCQIATLWNLWRFHRLLLLKITIVATQIIFSDSPRGGHAGNERLVTTTMKSATQVSSIQELVDSICHSVPFYLGNRTKPSSLSDFTDLQIQFPSYHLIAPDDARITGGQFQHRHSLPLSVDEHHRHMVAYGAWHIVSPLSNLLTLFSDDHGGQLLGGLLRTGQQDWIREQFLRVCTLVRLPMDLKSADGPAAESLAKQVRRGAIFMSGP